MKKTFITYLIISALAILTLCGCKRGGEKMNSVSPEVTKNTTVSYETVSIDTNTTSDEDLQHENPPTEYVVEDRGQFGYGVRAEHTYTGFAEIGYTFEQGCGGQVSADMQYAPILIYPLHTLPYLTAQHVEFFGICKRGIASCVKILPYFAEYPWRSYSPPAHHDGIHTVFVEIFGRYFGRCDITVAYQGDITLRIVSEPADQ